MRSALAQTITQLPDDMLDEMLRAFDDMADKARKWDNLQAGVIEAQAEPPLLQG